MGIQIDNYKQYNIDYSEKDNLFIASDKDGEEICSNTSLVGLKIKIDKLEKKVFKRFPAWYYEENIIRKVEVTSINYHLNTGWIIDKAGRREKIYFSNWNNDADKLILDIKENQENIEQIVSLLKQEEALRKQRVKLIKATKKFEFKSLSKEEE